MSSINTRLSRLENLKKGQVVATTKQPSISDMADGDERIVLSGGNKLRLYRKEFGKLWYMEFESI